jgi:hypothetical protein
MDYDHYDAPLIDIDPIADVSDVYVADLTRDGAGDPSGEPGATEPEQAVLLGLYDTASASDDSYDLETEGEFQFLSLPGGNGTAAHDSATPAPDEPEESDYLRELREVDSAIDTNWARHSALRSTLMQAAYG